MDLDLIRIFVKVVQHGSFSRAAHSLLLPKSTVSKAVSRLERETGTKLLVRTTRSLSLTDAGRTFFEASLRPVQQLEDAQKSLHGHDSRLTGLVRITAPEDIGGHVLAPVIAALSVEHPELRFELEYTDAVLDLVKEGFDLAVRIGRVSESSFKAKRAGELVLTPVASPRYLKGKPKIRKPVDLASQVCFSHSSQGLRDRWSLRSGRATAQVEVTPSIMSNQMTSLLRLTVAGAGVTLLPRFLCRPFVESGELVEVLPDWVSPGMAVWMISPLATSSSARLKVTSERIHAELVKALAR